MLEHWKSTLDGAALAVALGILLGWVPLIVGILTGVWTVMRIYREYLEIQKLKNR